MVGDRDRALAAGFDDYLSKPVDPKELDARISRVLDNQRLHAEVSQLREQVRQQSDFTMLFGTSPRMLEVKLTIEQAFEHQFVNQLGEAGRRWFAERATGAFRGVGQHDRGDLFALRLGAGIAKRVFQRLGHFSGVGVLALILLKAKGFVNGVMRRVAELVTAEFTDKPAADAVPFDTASANSDRKEGGGGSTPSLPAW